MDVKDCLLSVLYEICFVDIQSVSEYKISMKEDVKKFLGIKVRSMRENAGLTQEELAAICDVSWRTISNLERGLVVPDLLMVFKIAKRFQVSIDEMMGERLSVQKSIRRLEDENIIMEKIRNMDDRLLGYVSDQLDMLSKHFRAKK